MIQQLRIYEIFENNKAAFHARFRDHAARIMQNRYGFRIVAMWETKFGDRTEFAYLLEWPDEAAKIAAWSAFMADTEWSEIKRVTHAEHDGGPDRGPFACGNRLFGGERREPSCGISVESTTCAPDEDKTARVCAASEVRDRP